MASRKFLFTRKRRCKTCKNCLRENCGVCVFCKDKIMFGGANSLKQCCINKRCLNPKGSSTAIHAQKHKHLKKPAIPPNWKPPESHVLLRNICDKKLLSKFKKKSLENETSAEDTNTDAEEVKDDASLTYQKLGRSQRKRKVNVHYMNPAEYVPTLKSRKKECVIKKDPLADVHIDKLIEHLERQNETDRESLFVKRFEKIIETKSARPQTAKTKKKKLMPFEYLQYLPFSVAKENPEAFSVIKSEPCLSPPLLTAHDSENTAIDGLKNTHDHVLGPPVLEPCKNDKETFRVSFSGRCCKPNDAYLHEFYTDLKKIPNLNNKSIHRRKQKGQDKQSDKGLDKSLSHRKQEAETAGESMTQVKMSTGQLTSHVKKSAGQLKKVESKTTKKDVMATSLDKMMEKAEIDSQNSKPESRIPVYQNQIMETVKELAREKKFVKFFQLNVGNKLIFIPTDGATVIPKAYVMNKASKAPEEANISNSAATKIQPTGPGTTTLPAECSTTVQKSDQAAFDIIKQEPLENTDDGQLLENSDDGTLPKITSVFSLSSNADKDCTESDIPTDAKFISASNMKVQIENSQNETNVVPYENSASRKLRSLINPDMTKQSPETERKQLQSLLKHTISKVFDNRQKTAMNVSRTVEVENKGKLPKVKAAADLLQDLSNQSGVHYYVTSETPAAGTSVENNPAASKKMNLSNFGRLEPLEKITSKALNQTLPSCDMPCLVQKEIVSRAAPPKLVLLPPSNSPNSPNRTAVFVTSTLANTKLQSLLSNSKVKFVGSKSQTIVKSAEVKVTKSGNLMPDNTGLSGEFSRSPAKPLLLFPNKANTNYQTIPRTTTSRVLTNLQSLVGQSSQAFIPLNNSEVSNSSVWSRPVVKTATITTTSVVTPSVQRTVSSIPQEACTNKLLTSKTSAFDEVKTVKNNSDTTQNISQKNKQSVSTSGQEWVRVKSEPGDKHEFEATILTDIKKERSDSETESETETAGYFDNSILEGKTRRRKHRLDYTFTHVEAEETDTKERIRRLREKLREQQEECESLKKTLLNDSEAT